MFMTPGHYHGEKIIDVPIDYTAQILWKKGERVVFNKAKKFDHNPNAEEYTVSLERNRWGWWAWTVEFGSLIAIRCERPLGQKLWAMLPLVTSLSSFWEQFPRSRI